MSFLSLYLLAVLSEAFQHSWSLFLELSLLDFQEPVSLSFLFHWPSLWSPQPLNTVGYQCFSPRPLFFTQVNQVTSSRFLILCLEGSQIFYLHLRSFSTSSFIYSAMTTKTQILILYFPFHIHSSFQRMAISFYLSSQKTSASFLTFMFLLLPHSKWQQILLTLLSIYILSPATFHHLHSRLTWAIVISSLDDCNHTSTLQPSLMCNWFPSPQEERSFQCSSDYVSAWLKSLRW